MNINRGKKFVPLQDGRKARRPIDFGLRIINEDLFASRCNMTKAWVKNDCRSNACCCRCLVHSVPDRPIWIHKLWKAQTNKHQKKGLPLVHFLVESLLAQMVFLLPVLNFFCFALGITRFLVYCKSVGPVRLAGAMFSQCWLIYLFEQAPSTHTHTI